MAIEIQQEKRANPFLWLVILVILGVGGWFLWNFLKPQKLIKEPQIKDILPQSSQMLLQAKLDTQSVLNHPVFQSLSSHISWPLPSVQLGKTNPFQPF